MARHELPGQQSFDFFSDDKPKRARYAEPCPIRDDCGAYHCETGGCEGLRGWCERAKKATCQHESTVVDIGGGKSFCDLWQRWTNCREVGHCVYQSIGGDN